MSTRPLAHLKQLETESIYIIREVAAEFEQPVMLYSTGKDSAVMLHLAMKAFYPGNPPFSADAHRYHVVIPRDDRIPRPEPPLGPQEPATRDVEPG